MQGTVVRRWLIGGCLVRPQLSHPEHEDDGDCWYSH